jgi:hypothetical protein
VFYLLGLDKFKDFSFVVLFGVGGVDLELEELNKFITTIKDGFVG